MSKKQAKLFLL